MKNIFPKFLFEIHINNADDKMLKPRAERDPPHINVCNVKNMIGKQSTLQIFFFYSIKN